MKKSLPRLLLAACALLLSASFFPAACQSSNAVLGEIHFEGNSDAARTSGVWVDGEYVGYLKELKGSKKLLLLPGQHSIVVRQDGYKDFARQVTVQPGEEQLVRVAMERDAQPLPPVTATVKISANPDRAAVFMDGLFVGHVGEFNRGQPGSADSSRQTPNQNCIAGLPIVRGGYRPAAGSKGGNQD